MEKYLKKIRLLLISIILFSILYLFFDNSHFAGLNPIQDKLKEDEIEEKTEEVKVEAEKDVLEAFYTFVDSKKEPEEKIKDDVEKVAQTEKEKIESPSLFQNLFDRFYFSVITACLVGYGDIYPSTNTMKCIVSLQTFMTLALILY